MMWRLARVFCVASILIVIGGPTGSLAQCVYASQCCDDMNPCTVSDACQEAGPDLVCSGVPRCDDGNPCTFDTCTAALPSDPPGTPPQCSHTPTPGAACDDGDPCTYADVCTGAACSGTPASNANPEPCRYPICNGLGGVVMAPLGGASCSDGNRCTTGDACSTDGLTCLPGQPLSCDDGNPCTTDSCAPDVGCTHAPLASGTPCNTGFPCEPNATCQYGRCIGLDQVAWGSCNAFGQIHGCDDRYFWGCVGAPYPTLATPPTPILAMEFQPDAMDPSKVADLPSCATPPYLGTPACPEQPAGVSSSCAKPSCYRQNCANQGGTLECTDAGLPAPFVHGRSDSNSASDDTALRLTGTSGSPASGGVLVLRSRDVFDWSKAPPSWPQEDKQCGPGWKGAVALWIGLDEYFGDAPKTVTILDSNKSYFNGASRGWRMQLQLGTGSAGPKLEFIATDDAGSPPDPTKFQVLRAKPREWTRGEWHHVAVTWGPAYVRMYIDGRLADRASRSAFFPTCEHLPDTLSLASTARGGGTFTPADGTIRVDRFWSYLQELSHEDIVALYNGQLDTNGAEGPRVVAGRTVLELLASQDGFGLRGISDITSGTAKTADVASRQLWQLRLRDAHAPGAYWPSGTDYVPKWLTITNTAVELPGANITRTALGTNPPNSGWTLQWVNIPLPDPVTYTGTGGGTLSVTVTAVPSVWPLAITNHGRNAIDLKLTASLSSDVWTLYETGFPKLGGLGPIAGATSGGATTHVVTPSHTIGADMADPFPFHVKSFDGSGAATSFLGNGPDWSETDQTWYPTAAWSMPWFGLYDSVTKDGGLFVAMHDTYEPRLKRLAYRNSSLLFPGTKLTGFPATTLATPCESTVPTPDSTTCASGTCPFGADRLVRSCALLSPDDPSVDVMITTPAENIGLGNNTTTASTWEATIGLEDGDWFDLARRYRAMGTSSKWAVKGRLAERADVPTWLTNTGLIHSGAGGNFARQLCQYSIGLNPGPSVSKLVLNHSRTWNLPNHVFRGNNSQPNNMPFVVPHPDFDWESDPITQSSASSFRHDLVLDCSYQGQWAGGESSALYFLPTRWDKEPDELYFPELANLITSYDPQWSEQVAGFPGILGEAGRAYMDDAGLFNEPPALLGSCHPVDRFALMCPGAIDWQDAVRDGVVAAAGSPTYPGGVHPVHGVYLDELAMKKPELCFAADHAHLPGGGSWWTGGYRDSLTAARTQARIGYADAGFYAEGFAEPYVDFVDAFLVYNAGLENTVPIAMAVYHDFTQFMGMCTWEESSLESAGARFAKQGLIYTWGGIPGWIKNAPNELQVSQGLYRFAMNLGRYRRQYADFLVRGEMRRPPDVRDHGTAEPGVACSGTGDGVVVTSGGTLQPGTPAPLSLVATDASNHTLSAWQVSPVLASAWRSPDRRAALALTSVDTSSGHKVGVQLSFSDLGIVAASATIRVKTLTSSLLVTPNAADQTVIEVTLPKCASVVVEVCGNPCTAP